MFHAVVCQMPDETRGGAHVGHMRGVFRHAAADTASSMLSFTLVFYLSASAYRLSPCEHRLSLCVHRLSASACMQTVCLYVPAWRWTVCM